MKRTKYATSQNSTFFLFWSIVTYQNHTKLIDLEEYNVKWFVNREFQKQLVLPKSFENVDAVAGIIMLNCEIQSLTFSYIGLKRKMIQSHALSIESDSGLLKSKISHLGRQHCLPLKRKSTFFLIFWKESGSEGAYRMKKKIIKKPFEFILWGNHSLR